MISKPLEQDPKLMEKVRWIVERGQHTPEDKIEKQHELPLPMPPRESEKTDNHSRTSAALANAYLDLL